MAAQKNTAVVDPAFRELVPPLSADERQQLEDNILRDGCRDPLVTWNGLLLDGHNRYDICLTHDLPFATVAVDLPSREAAEDWIDTNQLGRRNLTPDQASLLRGRRYLRAKKPHGGDRRSESSGQNAHSVEPERTAERLATQHGVDERTIRRDGQFAAAVDALKPHVPDIESRVMSGDVPSKQAVVDAAKAPEKAVEILGKPHVSHNSGNNEWYTPAIYIAAARAAMGSIDVDPASSAIANATVGAAVFYTADDDGLAKIWRGSVWMNPPYAQPLMGQFAEAVSHKYRTNEIQRACVLVNNATETAWFQGMLLEASAVCFLRGRVRFLDITGSPVGMPLQGQAVIYLGEDPDRFAASFADLGTVLWRQR